MGSDTGDFRFGLDEIRAHTAWCRRLAAALVRGEGDADDAVQDLWVAGLTHPPAAADGIRAWLRVVLGNVLRKQHRGQSRRRIRETAAATTAQVITPMAPDSEELALRMEAQRLVADLVLGLDEPLRSTILLRHYEDFTPAQIAARQGVPAGTVRWRLKAARDQLRAQLEARYAGRRSWRSLLLPLSPPAAITRGVRDPAIWKGLLAMKVGTKVGAGALALILLLGLFVGIARWRVPGSQVAVTAAGQGTADMAVARTATSDPRPAAGVQGAERGRGTAPSRPRVHIPRFVTAPAAREDAGATLGAGIGRRLADDHGHLTNRIPDGGGIEAAQLVRIEDQLDVMHERANQCLAGWQRLDPALTAGVMLGIAIDNDGLQDVWIDRQSAIPDGPLRCLSDAVYGLDWAGLSRNPATVTLPLRYDSGDAGARG